MSEKQKLALPPVSQIGVVVKDMEKTVEYLTRVFGIGPFMIRKASPGPKQCWIKGKPFISDPHPMAFAQMGPVQLELIQPPSAGIHRDFLERKGEGVHHLCYVVDNYDTWMEHLKEQGIETLMNAVFENPEKGLVRVAYLESEAPGGVLVEIAEAIPKVVANR